MTETAQALSTLEESGAEVFWIERPGGIRMRVCRLPSTAPEGSANRTMLFLHGYTEFLEKYAFEVFGRLRAMGYTVWSFDWRGQGLSSRLLDDRLRGHIESFEDHLDDAKSILARVLERDGGNILLAGHSMGGHLAMRLAAEKGEAISDVICLSPMSGIYTKGFPKPIARGLLGLFSTIGLGERYPPGVEPFHPKDKAYEGNVLTSDERRFRFVRQAVTDNPDLAIGAPTIGWASAAFASIARLSKPEYLAQISMPVTLFVSGVDRVVDNEATHAIARDLPDATVIDVADAEHELLMEQDHFQAPVWAKFEELI